MSPLVEAEFDTQVCVIGGSGRSGTSILSRIFQSHAKVGWAPELRFLIDPDGLIDVLNSAGQWSPFHHEVRIRRLRTLLHSVGHRSEPIVKSVAAINRLGSGRLPRKTRPAYAGIGATEAIPNFDQHVEQLISDLTDFWWSGDWDGMPFMSHRSCSYRDPSSRSEVAAVIRSFLVSLINDLLAGSEATHYLEKNTWSILWFREIQELLPSARMVHIVRDPRDVVASFMQQNWAPEDPVAAARFLMGIHRRWWDVLDETDPETVLEIRLEDLASEPSAILGSVCEHWRLPWDDALLSTDLSRANTGRWRRDIPAASINAVERELAPLCERYDYE